MEIRGRKEMFNGEVPTIVQAYNCLCSEFNNGGWERRDNMSESYASCVNQVANS